jgi:ribosomal protein L28
MHAIQGMAGSLFAKVEQVKRWCGASDKFDQGRRKWRVEICDIQLWIRREKRSVSMITCNNAQALLGVNKEVLLGLKSCFKMAQQTMLGSLLWLWPILK